MCVLLILLKKLTWDCSKMRSEMKLRDALSIPVWSGMIFTIAKIWNLLLPLQPFMTVYWRLVSKMDLISLSLEKVAFFKISNSIFTTIYYLGISSMSSYGRSMRICILQAIWIKCVNRMRLLYFTTTSSSFSKCGCLD